MDVPSCLVRTETFPLGIWEEADSMGRTSLAEGETQHRFGGMCVAQGPDILLPTWTFSSPPDVPLPGPGPVARTALLWRPGSDSCGCVTAASHCRGGHCHLETASEYHSSPLQGRLHFPQVSHPKRMVMPDFRSKHVLHLRKEVVGN